jgi:glycosyltransferase involved in cell wall biosynthesis
MGIRTRAARLAKRMVEDYRSLRDLGPGMKLRFLRDRRSTSYRRAYEAEQPLVSILICTYNRSSLLVERSVSSALNQTYMNIEILVIGDCCTDDTEARLSAIADERLHFENLPERGKYPDDPDLRWMVAGFVPFNRALKLAKGDFITHLDDDDEFAPDRVEKLVEFIRKTRADLVFHPFRHELPDGSWDLNGARRFDYAKVTSSSIFYHRWLLAVEGDLHCYRYREPGDWNRLRKIRWLGARIRRYPEPLMLHYRERNQKPAAA